MPLARIPLTACRKVGVGVQTARGRRRRPRRPRLGLGPTERLRRDPARRRAAPRRQGRRRAERHQHGRARAASSSPTSKPGRCNASTSRAATVEVALQRGRRAPLTASNYPILDRNGNIWCANSTFAHPWQQALDGRADGMLFRIRPDGRAETDGGRHPVRQRPGARRRRVAHLRLPDHRLQRHPLPPSAPTAASARPSRTGRCSAPRSRATSIPRNLPAPERMAQVGLTDGCGFDVEGNLWVTLVAANRIVAITPRGDVVPDPR